METPTLSAFIQPSVFSDKAIASARNGNVLELTTNLCIIRFWLALSEGDNRVAAECLARLSFEELGGWPLYQLTTGAIFLAIKQGGEAQILAAIDAWLTGMAAYPGNWQKSLLVAPEIVPWLSHFDAKRLKPPPPAKRRLTARQRGFLRDIDGAILRVVSDNLQSLREIGFSEPVSVIANWYKLTDVYMRLRECTVSTNNDAPDLTIALDEAGNYEGGFISH
jgi:hypothetical protein